MPIHTTILIMPLYTPTYVHMPSYSDTYLLCTHIHTYKYIKTYIYTYTVNLNAVSRNLNEVKHLRVFSVSEWLIIWVGPGSLNMHCLQII